MAPAPSGLPDLAGAVRKAISDRYDDLRWCNKDDLCHVKAEGVALALGDFDDAIARSRSTAVAPELDVELVGLARAAVASLESLLSSTDARDDSTPLSDLIDPAWADELRDFIVTANEAFERHGYASLAATEADRAEEGPG